MDDFYAARSSTMPPLTWTNFAPPFSLAEKIAGLDAECASAQPLTIPCGG